MIWSWGNWWLCGWFWWCRGHVWARFWQKIFFLKVIVIWRQQLSAKGENCLLTEGGQTHATCQFAMILCHSHLDCWALRRNRFEGWGIVERKRYPDHLEMMNHFFFFSDGLFERFDSNQPAALLEEWAAFQLPALDYAILNCLCRKEIFLWTFLWKNWKKTEILRANSVHSLVFDLSSMRLCLSQITDFDITIVTCYRLITYCINSKEKSKCPNDVSHAKYNGIGN